MLTADIKGCADCDSISSSITLIDQELTAMSVLRVDSERFQLDRYIDKQKIDTLIVYKRVLQRKLRNPAYLACSCVELGDIISRIKTLAVSKPRKYPCDSSIGAPLSSITPCD